MKPIRTLQKAIRNPNTAAKVLNRKWHTNNNRWRYNKKGDDFFDEDWDNLVILDACRYDTFENLNYIDGKLDFRISRGSATLEFLRGQFNGKEALDTVYITSNPQLYRIQNGVYDKGYTIDVKFHEQIQVWKDSWDDDFRTVRPEVMVKETISAAKEHPNKRLLIHFMQPHYPFIGPTGQQHFDLDSLSFEWASKEFGSKEREVVRRAYEENLELCLPHVENVLEELVGKTVITADHGQVLGERGRPIPVRMYGHPEGHYIPELVKVPWFVCESDTRKEVNEGVNKQQHPDIEKDIIEDRLNSLGYIQ